MSFGIIRLKFYGVAVSNDGITQLCLLLQDRPEIIVAYRIVRPQLDLLAKEPFRSGEIALLGRDDCKIAMGNRVAGIHAYDR